MAPSLLALTLLAAGCSGDDESPLDAAPTTSAEPTADAEDPEADALAAWEAYWDAVVEAQNTADADGVAADRLSAVAASEVVELELSIIERYQGYGLTRTGAPEFADVSVQVEDDTATVAGCVNEDDWGAVVDGEPVAEEDRGFEPHGATLENQDGTWRVTELQVPEGLTC